MAKEASDHKAPVQEVEIIEIVVLKHNKGKGFQIVTKKSWDKAKKSFASEGWGLASDKEKEEYLKTKANVKLEETTAVREVPVRRKTNPPRTNVDEHPISKAKVAPVKEKTKASESEGKK